METAGKRLRDAREDAGESWPALRDWLIEELGRTYVPSVDTLRRMEKSKDGSDWDPIIAGAISDKLGVKLRDLSMVAADVLARQRDLLERMSPCTPILAGAAA